MNDPFFMSSGARKRKARPQGKPSSQVAKKDGAKAKAKPARTLQDEVRSDDENSMSEGEQRRQSESESEESDHETAAEKKVRLANEYLDLIKAQEEADRSGSDEEDDVDVVSQRLRQDHMEKEGKVDRHVAEKYTAPIEPSRIRRLRGHKMPVTCVALTNDEKYAFSGSKDCSIMKWDLETGKRVATIPGGLKTAKNHNGHTDHVLAMCVSTDGNFLATGGRDQIVFIWDAVTMELVKRFPGHRDAITALAFRKNSHTLFSGSKDRTVKLWNLDEMAYIETLYGHQDAVSSIDSLSKERAVSVGSRDRTLRLWKIVEESQLIFNGHVGNTECVKMINENMFLTCGEDGSICLWTIFKKKPVDTLLYAHANLPETDVGAANNEQEEVEEEEEKITNEQEMMLEIEGKTLRKPNKSNKKKRAVVPEALKGTVAPWVTALACIPNTDLIASGSHTGFVKLWQITDDKCFKQIQNIPVAGYINGLAISSKGRYVVAAVGQEHRLGRWDRNKEARNGLCIIPLDPEKEEEIEEGDGESVSVEEGASVAGEEMEDDGFHISIPEILENGAVCDSEEDAAA